MNFEMMPATQEKKKELVKNQGTEAPEGAEAAPSDETESGKATENPEAAPAEDRVAEAPEAAPADESELNKATETGESAAKVLEHGTTQEAFNKLIETMRGSVAMKPFEAVWNAMPGRLQKAIVNPNLFERVVKMNPALMAPATWFEKMAKSGLLEMKAVEGVEGEGVLEQGRQNDEDVLKFASDVGNLATEGEASGFIGMLEKVANAQENLMEGSRKHLSEIKEAEEIKEKVQNLEKAEEIEKETNLNDIRKDIAKAESPEKTQ